MQVRPSQVSVLVVFNGRTCINYRYKLSKSHNQCFSCTKWKGNHPAESKEIIEEACQKPKAVFIPMNEFINVHGRDVKITRALRVLILLV